MKCKNFKYLLFVCTLGAFAAYGQTELSAKEAVFMALENNYQIQIANKQLEISEKQNRWGEAGAFPTVSLSVGNNNTIQDNTNNPLTFTPGVILSQSINPSLTLDYNIFSGFSVFISKRRLEQLEEQSAQNALSVIEATIQDVLRAYYGVQLQKERTDLFREVLNLSRDRKKLYDLKEKYSTSTSLESLQFRNQYLTDSINVVLQEISLENAHRNLKILMNDTTDVQYFLTDKLEIANELPILSDAHQQLLENNTDLRKQFIGLELQRTNTELQRSFLYPTINFQAGFAPGWSWIRNLQDNPNSPFNEISTNNITYFGNLNLRYTLYNNWKNKRAVEVAKIQEEITALGVEDLKQNLKSTLDNLLALYEARTQLVSVSAENLQYAEQAFDIAKKRFDLGTINSVDLMTFQNNYQNTLIQHYENQFNRLDTYLEIYKLLGKISLDYAE